MSQLTVTNVLQQQLPKIKEIFDRNGFDPGCLDRLVPLIERFEIRVPLIGSFSCGKSSLLNRLLDECVLSTDLMPKTAVPAELRYGKERRFFGCFPDGRRVPLAENDVRDNHLAQLLPNGWVEAELPNPVLAAWRRLVLVDLPGLDSGIEAHIRVIDQYADRSLVYCVLVSVEEGGLRDSLRRALLELAIREMHVVLVVSKADKRSPEDVEAVARHLRSEMAKLMGREPLALAVTSARKNDLAAFRAALDALEARADEVFCQRVVEPYRQTLRQACQNLGQLAQQEYPDAHQLQAEIERLEQELSAFDERLTRETAMLDEQIGPILGTIRRRVENALVGRLDYLADRALAGGDISDDILGTARLVVAEAIKQEFEPALQRYLDRVADALPSRLDFNLDLGRMGGEAASKGHGEFRWKALGGTLMPLLRAIPHPIGKLLSLAAPVLGVLMDSFSDKRRQEVEEARRRERAISSIRAAMTDAVRQIEAKLGDALGEQVKRAKEEVKRSIEAEKNEVQKTLARQIEALRQGEAETARLRESAQAYLAQIQTFLAELPPCAPVTGGRS